VSEFLNYVVRSLLSEGRVRYETVEKTPKGLQARLIEREGPTGLVMTTTAVSQHPENETRQLVITMSDSRDQTKQILEAVATRYSGKKVGTNPLEAEQMEKWQALQEWLGYANHDVMIPFAPTVARLIPPVAVRLRRDIEAVFNLIAAHAILHQANRKRDDAGRIIATLKDYEAVRSLVGPIISQGVEQTVSKKMRETVSAVGQICSVKEESERRVSGEPAVATIREVAKELRIDRSSASRRVNEALKNSYLKNLETKQGQPHKLVVGDPLPDQPSVLPTVEEIKGEWKKLG
jgi:hypothetical protein